MALEIDALEVAKEVTLEVRLKHTGIAIFRMRCAVQLLRWASKFAPMEIAFGISHSAAAMLFYCTYCGRDFFWDGLGPPDCGHCGAHYFAVTNQSGEVTLYTLGGPDG